jgi:hypothetical protein
VPILPAILRYFASGPDKPPLRDPKQIDRLYKRYRITIMTAITLGYGIAYMCRLGLSVVKKPLIDDGIFSADQLGTIGSAIFYAYAFGKLVNGFLADHANMKKFLAFGVLISALINIFMGWSTVLWVWVVLWALNGWFQGFGAPAGVVAMLAAMVTWFGWRAGFVGPGIICVVLAIVLYVVMEDRPQTLGLPAVADWKNDRLAKPADGAEKPKSTWQMQLSILKYPSIWVLALSSALMIMRHLCGASEQMTNLSVYTRSSQRPRFRERWTDIEAAARILAGYGPKEIVLTHSQGVLVFADGRFHQAPFRPQKLVGRSGRGDTCIASYVCKRLTASPHEATIWAAAVTSLKMEAEGPIGWWGRRFRLPTNLYTGR